MTLPIRRLPILVIELILQTMGFLDLFLITRTSTIMKRIVKNMHRTQNHYLFVTIEEPLLIQIQSKTNLEYAEEIYVIAKKRKLRRRCTFSMEIGSMDRFPSAIYEGDDGLIELYTFWKDTKAGCIALCNELVEVFRTPVKGAILNLDEVENYQNEINWVNSTFPALISFTIRGKCSFQDYMWMIRNSRATIALKFEMEPTEYPENIDEIVLLDLEEISIEHGKWVNLKQLQAIRSDKINLMDVSLTDSEINEFLRNLNISKEKPKFDTMGIFFVGEADPNVVLEGLISEEEGASKLEDILHGFVFKTGNGQKCTILYCELENETDQPDVEMNGFKIEIEN